ncbi:MAG: diguanylate cyclase [Burkholderiales bacterium]|nr:diguanylate cyclase [Burkholderiales bacterium]
MSKGGASSAAQESAVIAREIALDSREMLQVLLDYLPSAVTLFGPDLEMIACNAKLRELLEFPDELFAHGLPSLPTLLRFNALRGEYGPGDAEAITAAAVARAREMQPHVFERTRPNGVVLEIRGTPLPGGGFVTIYTDITERRQADKAVRDSGAELHLLTDNVPAMILYVDSDMNCVFANKRYADFFKLAVADIIGRPFVEIVGRAAYAEIEGHFREALAGHPVAYQRAVRLASGALRHLDVKLVPRTAEHGSIPGCYSMAIDITEQKQTEQALRDSVEQMRMFTDNVPSMTVSWDENLRCLFANKRFAEFYGLEVGDLPGMHVREVIGEHAFRDVEDHFALVLRGHPDAYQRLHKFANGSSRYIEVKLLPHVAEDGGILGCYAVTTDITEQKQAEQRIQHLAHHDNLTGLPNRLLFNDRLGQEISFAKRGARRFALFYLDLDKFKPVNDALGHNAGDELLRIVSNRLREQVRESDTVARVGGDEFAVILRDIDSREDIVTIAEKIVAALAQPFHLEPREHRVDIGTSIGIALYPDHAQDHQSLVKLADAAMYSAKAHGSCYRFCAD